MLPWVTLLQVHAASCIVYTGTVDITAASGQGRARGAHRCRVLLLLFLLPRFHSLKDTLKHYHAADIRAAQIGRGSGRGFSCVSTCPVLCQLVQCLRFGGPSPECQQYHSLSIKQGRHRSSLFAVACRSPLPRQLHSATCPREAHVWCNYNNIP